ncbi:MAG: molybdenum cofactor biosynthesis protein MoaE [Bdellovibrionales bacterium]|nr:molybdenum cofactor biosynthesis protein MoaE [Bdellovibrionales bacterium]
MSFGAVRDFNGGKNVVAVSYDAFEPLAEQVFRDIAGEACQKWGNELRIYIVHRVGKLLCGDTSVGIGVSSRHRDEPIRPPVMSLKISSTELQYGKRNFMKMEKRNG